jgi:hypothetical protein
MLVKTEIVNVNQCNTTRMGYNDLICRFILHYLIVLFCVVNSFKLFYKNIFFTHYTTGSLVQNQFMMVNVMYLSVRTSVPLKKKSSFEYL